MSKNAQGKIRSTDTVRFTTSAGGGQCNTITPACGLGKEMVANLDKVVANYKRQLVIDQGPAKAEALKANGARRAQRDAQSSLALDALLAELLG